MSFAPVRRGTEQDGTRPALVISTSGMHEITHRAIVCPIAKNTRPWPTKALLPPGLAASGAVLVDQVRSIDRSARILRYLGRASDDTLADVRGMLLSLIGIDLEALGTGSEGP